MGWAIGDDSKWGRDIGYGVPAWCDHPACDEEIDRGLAYVCCGQEPYGGDRGCGLYFCPDHQRGDGQCIRCYHRNPRGPYQPKPDHPAWVEWKLTDASWAEWRAAQTTERLDAMRAIVAANEGALAAYLNEREVSG